MTIDKKMHRNTKQREAILNILRGTDAHPTADAIYDAVRKVIPNISKGTIYRNLNLLRETSQISELNLNGPEPKADSGEPPFEVSGQTSRQPYTYP